MTHENDMPGDGRPRPVEIDATAGDDAARRYLSEQAEAAVECEHHLHPQESDGVSESAEILKDWGSADTLTREKLLDAVGREMMHAHEAPPPELQTRPMEPGYRGVYVDEDFRMEMNEDLPKGELRDALHTYLHEYRHAEQAYEIQKSHTALWSPENVPRANALEANGRDYVDPEVDYDQYKEQLVERDANQFADATTDAILEQLKADPAGPRTGKT